MPFDSQGNFTRLHNWEDDRINDIDIVTDHADEEDDNFASGLSLTFLRDGRVPMGGDLDAGSFKVKNVARGTLPSDATNKEQMDTALALKEDLSNKVTAFDNPTDDQYPSAKLVNDTANNLSNIDLSNLTAAAKKEIMKIIAPNHNRRSNVTFPETATEAGWVFGGWGSRNTGSVYINGTQIGVISSDPDGTNASSFTGFMDVGDKLTLSGTAPSFCSFVPCKGN